MLIQFIDSLPLSQVQFDRTVSMKHRPFNEFALYFPIIPSRRHKNFQARKKAPPSFQFLFS